MPPKKEERKKGTWRATSPPRQRADNTSSDPAQEDAPVAQPSSSERASAGKRQRTTMDSEKKKFDEDVIELQSSLFRLKGNYRKRWVSEWFALQHNFFISFRSQDRLEVKKCIALVSIIEVKKMPVKRHPTQFAVQYALGPDFKKLELLLLKAETPDLGEQWISTLTESVKKAKAADPSHSHALGHFLTLTDAFRRYQTMKGEMFHHHLSSVFRSVYRMGRARERFLCAFFFAQMRRHVRSEKEKEHVMKVEAISGDLKTVRRKQGAVCLVHSLLPFLSRCFLRLRLYGGPGPSLPALDSLAHVLAKERCRATEAEHHWRSFLLRHLALRLRVRGEREAFSLWKETAGVLRGPRMLSLQGHLSRVRQVVSVGCRRSLAAALDQWRRVSRLRGLQKEGLRRCLRRRSACIKRAAWMRLCEGAVRIGLEKYTALICLEGLSSKWRAQELSWAMRTWTVFCMSAETQRVTEVAEQASKMNEALIASAHHLPLSQGVSSLDFLFRARNQRLALAALHTMRTETQRASAREQALLRGLMKGVKRIARVGAERVKREALTTLRQCLTHARARLACAERGLWKLSAVWRRVAHEFKKEALIRLEVSTTGRRALPFSRIAASLLNRHKKAHAAAAASALSGRRGQTRGGTKQGGGPVMRTVLESPAGRGGGLAIRTLPSIDSAGGLVEGDYDEEDDGEGLGVIGGFLVGKNGGGGLEASAEERNQFISRLRLALFTFAAALRNLERKRQHAQFVALLQFQRNKRGAELLQTLVRSMCTRRLVPLAAARQRLKALAALKDLQLHAATTSGSLLEKQIRRIAGRGKEEGDGGMVSSAHQVLQSAIHSARTGEGEGGLKGRRTDSPSSRVRVSAEVQGGDQPVSIRSGQWEVNVVPSASPSPSPTHGGRESSGIPATRLHALRDSQSGTPAGLLRSGQTVSRYPTTAALSSALHGGGCWVVGQTTSPLQLLLLP